jgi:hypothetical protein
MDSSGPPASPGEPSGRDGELPPIEDPYLRARPVPPRAPVGVSRVAVISLVAAFLGPIGALVAILGGVSAWREIGRSAGRQTGRALAAAASVLGVVALAAWSVVFAAKLQRFAASDHPVPTVARPAPRGGARPRAPLPAPTPRIPRDTQLEAVGSITVVDVGKSVAALEKELTAQLLAAAQRRETVLVMTTGASCDPCRGVDASLIDARLQEALAGVRLVRVDLDVFREDLDLIGIPHDRYPGFFLLGPDGRPRDGIDGGEWDEDVPENIAPVLGPFVKGAYVKRREMWRPPRTGIVL